jgi:hypothetical protein
VIGVFSVLEPEGFTVSTIASFPLFTLCTPPNVCLSIVDALSELPPHADRARQAATSAIDPTKSRQTVR